MSLLFTLGSNSGCSSYGSPDVINSNSKRMSCEACLSAGRLWIKDGDDREVMDKEFGASNDRYLILEECF